MSVYAQVKIPFDVPVPTWEILVSPKDTDNPPVIYQKPNASSDVLVSQCGEDCSFQWASRSAIPEWWDIVKLYGNHPLKAKDGGWINLEFDNGDEPLSVWTTAYSLRKIGTFKLTPQEIFDSNMMLAWEVGSDLYVVVESGGGVGYNTYHIGKYKDGYVVCPYYCFLEMDGDSAHPGILNGVVGGMAGLDKFTRRDVDYLLNHAAETAAPLVVYGYMDADGTKQIETINTGMVSYNVQKTITDDNSIYTTVETQPEFPGGLGALLSTLARNQKYPPLAAENGIQGKVTVSFVIERDGSVGDVNVIKSVSPELDKEAMRVVKLLPKFTPGKINGRAVRTKMNVPMIFRLK